MKASVIESDSAASSFDQRTHEVPSLPISVIPHLTFLSLCDFAFYLLFNFLLFYNSVMIIIEFAVITLMNVFIIFTIPRFLIRYCFLLFSFPLLTP